MIELDTLDTDEAQADAAAQRDREKGRGQIWRSFADRRGDEHLQKRRENEFMEGASDPPTAASRRSFMKIMGASMAMAGLAACRRPEQHILPYARKPEQQIPGVPRFYATAMPFRGVSRGLLVESSDGRPTKVEGNPEHPLTQGATSGFAQGSVLNLFDPWRSKTIRHNGADAAQDELLRQVGRLQGDNTRLAVLMEQTSSPAVARMRRRLREAYPSLRWVEYAPEGDDPERMGLQQVTGRPARPLYRFDRADVIASLDADFLSPTRRNYVSNTRTFAAGRRLESPEDEMSRLYAVESGFSLTGGQADHRLAMRPTKMPAFAQALASQMGAGGGDVAGGNANLTGRERAFAEELASDLRKAGERGLVLAGESQPPAVHALAMRLNQQLGATGTTVHLMDTGQQQYTPLSEELTQLVSDMRGGGVDALVMVGANPLYDLPESMGFREAMGSVGTTIHAGLRRNETAQAADWHVPRAHYLESWGDGRAYDGTVSLRQPLIKPLYEDAMSELELLHALATGRRRDGYDLLLAQYQERTGTAAGGGDAAVGQVGEGSDFDKAWRRALHRGYLPGTQYDGAPTGRQSPAGRSDQSAPRQTTMFSGLSFEGAGGAPSGDGASQNPQLAVTGTDTSAAAQPDTSAASSQNGGGGRNRPFPGASSEDGYEVVIQSDPSVLDGRFSNNAWMQETPDPITKLVWDNVAVMSPRTATELGVGVDYDAGSYDADVVRLTAAGGSGDAAASDSIELPVWIQPGFPDGTIGLHTGYGRNIAASGVGEEKGWFRNLTDAYESVYNGEPPANGVGENAARLLDDNLRRVLTGVQVEKAGEGYMLASTQEHGSMEGRPIVRRASMDDYRENPDFAEDAVHTLPGGEPWDEYPTLWKDNHPQDQPAYEDSDFHENQWGMAIDLNTCTGCNACMVACQSENNVQVVGKEQVAKGREMHWLRIDRYYVTPGGEGGHGSGHDGEGEGGGSHGEGSAGGQAGGNHGGGAAVQQSERDSIGDVEKGAYDDEVLQNDVQMVMQPVMCQHCENAPCESVCPVAATVHSPDGMNQMIYNRCIGTRYCSNNCPYKVRRFNFYNWSPDLPEQVKMAQNPNVTVRSRGVMEKCSWCVHRIRENQSRADNENRTLEDGDVLTACQQACPADAITFGDLNDPTSEVNRKKNNSRSYEMLAELNVKPRLSYLGRVSNPNPALKKRLAALPGSGGRQAATH